MSRTKKVTILSWGSILKIASVGQIILSFLRYVQDGNTIMRLAGILMNLALWMITQDWLVGVFGMVAAATYFGSIPLEEQGNLEKFGDTYESYRERVPCLYFIVGIVRELRRDRAL
jgi:hypothetical protein